MPVILICTLLFIVWLHYESKKSSKYSANKSEEFWRREQEANFTRKKDLSKLDYITVPLKNLPFSKNCSEEILKFQEKVEELAGKRILNLTGMTNTDLKAEYGVANFNEVSEYDTNYMELITSLNSWGLLLFNDEKYDDAETVFKYAISCGSDIKATYITLGSIYAVRHETDKIDELIHLAENNIEAFTKNSVITSLKNLKSNYMLSEKPDSDIDFEKLGFNENAGSDNSDL